MAVADEFRGREVHLTNPLTKLLAIAPANDVTDLPWVSRAIIVGVAGNVALIPMDGTVAVTVPLPAGINPIRASRILLTGTTATGIVAGS